MAKKRSRGPVRELSRAELKALERRAAGTGLPSRVAVVEPPVAAPAPPAEPAPRRGVLPPRASRVAAGLPALSRQQELAFIRDDLRRMVVLALIMLALIIALTFIVPLVVP
jgi:hypothetical protein